MRRGAVGADREARGCLAPPLLPETVACVSPGALTAYDVRNASESRLAGGLEAPDRAGPNAVGTGIGVRVPPPVSPCRAKSSPQSQSAPVRNRSTKRQRTSTNALWADGRVARVSPGGPGSAEALSRRRGELEEDQDAGRFVAHRLPGPGGGREPVSVHSVLEARAHTRREGRCRAGAACEGASATAQLVAAFAVRRFGWRQSHSRCWGPSRRSKAGRRRSAWRTCRPLPSPRR